MFRLASLSGRPIDQLRPGLIQAILHGLRALNANTRLLLRLLEEPDWSGLRRAMQQVRRHL